MNEEYINMILDQINVAKYRDEYKKNMGILILKSHCEIVILKEID